MLLVYVCVLFQCALWFNCRFFDMGWAYWLALPLLRDLSWCLFFFSKLSVFASFSSRPFYTEDICVSRCRSADLWIIFVFIQLFLPKKHMCAYRKAWTNILVCLFLIDFCLFVCFLYINFNVMLVKFISIENTDLIYSDCFQNYGTFINSNLFSSNFSWANSGYFLDGIVI